MSVIVFDLDDFKRINDRLGHLGGDAVLMAVADAVRSAVRETDIPCRVGGDEFAVILPESSRDDAELLADRIALAIRSQKIEKVGALKISAGVSELRRRRHRRRPVQARRRCTAPRQGLGQGAGRGELSRGFAARALAGALMLALAGASHGAPAALHS